MFEPRIEFELGEGWLRREATEERLIRLRSAVVDAALIVSQADFAQCGETLLERPSADELIDLITMTDVLSPGEPTALELFDRSGWVIDLPGTGQKLPEGEFPDPADGCIVTAGDEPFPAEALWTVFTPDIAAHLAVVDVGDETVMFTARAVPPGMPRFTEAVDALLATTRFPGAAPQD